MLTNEILKTGTITEVRLTAEGLEYLILDDDTGIETWYGADDVEDLISN